MADEGGEVFTFWVNVYASGAREGERLGRFRLVPRSALATNARTGGADPFVPDDGSAEIFVASNDDGLVMANRFPISSPFVLEQVSFYTSGASVGSEVDVIVYEDPQGRTDRPACWREVWRVRVTLGEGGFQDVRTGGLTLNAGGARDGAFRVAVAECGESAFPSLGIDLTGPAAGISFHSTNGGADFSPLSTVPVLDGTAMIRAGGRAAEGRFVETVAR